MSGKLSNRGWKPINGKKKTPLDIVRPCYVLAKEICFKHDFSHETNDSSPPEVDKKLFHFLLSIPKADERIRSPHGKVKA